MVEQFERNGSRAGHAAIGRVNQFRRPADVHVNGQTAADDFLANDRRLLLIKRGDRKADIPLAIANLEGRFQEHLQVAADFLRA